jgi:hypothetical protein
LYDEFQHSVRIYAEEYDVGTSMTPGMTREEEEP